jgi:hypothetical protein
MRIYSGNNRFPVHPDVVRAKAEMLEAFGTDDYGVKVVRLQNLLAQFHPPEDRPAAQRVLTDNHKASLKASWAAKRARRAVAFGTFRGDRP